MMQLVWFTGPTILYSRFWGRGSTRSMGCVKGNGARGYIPAHCSYWPGLESIPSHFYGYVWPPSIRPDYITKSIPHPTHFTPEDRDSRFFQNVASYKATQYYNPGGHNLNSHHCVNLKPYTRYNFFLVYRLIKQKTVWHQIKYCSYNAIWQCIFGFLLLNTQQGLDINLLYIHICAPLDFTPYECTVWPPRREQCLILTHKWKWSKEMKKISCRWKKS
jgi:hypothetical protein